MRHVRIGPSLAAKPNKPQYKEVTLRLKSVVSKEFKEIQEIISELRNLEHSQGTIIDCISYYEDMVALCMFASDERQAKPVRDWADEVTSRPAFGELFSESFHEQAKSIIRTARKEKNLLSDSFSRDKLALYSTLRKVNESNIERKIYSKIPYYLYAHRILGRLNFGLAGTFRSIRAPVFIFPQNEVIAFIEYCKRLRLSLQGKPGESMATSVNIFKFLYIEENTFNISYYSSERDSNRAVMEKIDELHAELASISKFSSFSENQMLLFLLFPTFREDYPFLTSIAFFRHREGPFSAIENQRGKFVWKLHMGVLARYVSDLPEHEKWKYALFESAFILPDGTPIQNLGKKAKQSYADEEAFLEQLTSCRNAKKTESV